MKQPFRFSQNICKLHSISCSFEPRFADVMILLLTKPTHRPLENMRIPKEQIKQAILHPEFSARMLALRYFSRSFDNDATIMPLVIDAVKEYGWQDSIHLVSEGRNLTQTEGTIQWCMDELRQNAERQSETRDSYELGLSEVLHNADPSLTLSLETEILAIPAFQSHRPADFSERIHLFSEDAESLWSKLSDFCEQNYKAELLAEINMDHANRIVEALGSSATVNAGQVLTMLAEPLDGSVNAPREFMQGFILRLAGEMRLTEAIPLLIPHMMQDDEWFNEECLRALIRIGGDDVIEALSREFPRADWIFRLFSCEVLENVHTATVAQKCLDLLYDDDDEAIRVNLAQAAISQFTTEAVEPVREFILANQLDPSILELRESLVAVSTVLDVDFPEMNEWKLDEEKLRSLNRELYAKQFSNVAETADDWDDEDFEDNYFDDEDEDGFPSIAESAHSPTTIVREDARTGRNDPCTCGSGKKYKKCCLK